MPAAQRPTLPDRGDIITFNLSAGAGSGRINGLHDCIVISHRVQHERINMGIVIPTSSSKTAAAKLGKLAVKLPPLPNMAKEGWAHLHQIQSVDFDDIRFSVKSRIDPDDEQQQAWLEDLIDRLFDLVAG